jgi:hypothetical protein
MSITNCSIERLDHIVAGAIKHLEKLWINKSESISDLLPTRARIII